MKVFIFDLLVYGENLDHIKEGIEPPYPLSKRHFKAEVAVRTYATWQELDRLGCDGVGFNEHQYSPYGLMNSPNHRASAAAMPHDMFIRQIRRFASGMLPRLQAHQVKRVPVAGALAA